MDLMKPGHVLVSPLSCNCPACCSCAHAPSDRLGGTAAGMLLSHIGLRVQGVEYKRGQEISLSAQVCMLVGL